jgi:hypothetical protein
MTEARDLSGEYLVSFSTRTAMNDMKHNKRNWRKNPQKVVDWQCYVAQQRLWAGRSTEERAYFLVMRDRMRSMRNGIILGCCVVALQCVDAHAAERQIVSLKDLSTVELKSAGINVQQPVTLHIKALGAADEQSRLEKGERMFAYAWILNADTRELVWKMDVSNTESAGGGRVFDGQLRLGRGSYEIYAAACTFTYHSLFTHITTNIDHRNDPVFGPGYHKEKGFFSFFKQWFAGDIAESWKEQAREWGVEVYVDESAYWLVRPFTAPKQLRNILLRATGLGDNAFIRQGFSLREPMKLKIYALGEGEGEGNLVDYGWIVETKGRSRVWEMDWGNCVHAGGDKKNLEWTGEVSLKRGDYVLYFITDDSHSTADWNSAPPYDPLNWGVTIMAADQKQMAQCKLFPYQEYKNVIVSMTRMGDDENRTEGFTLTQDARVRILAFGEREGFSRAMADYGYVIDAKQRTKVWTMDVDRTYHAGGGIKNRFADEVITLPRGNYLVTYVTDDSHAYGDWNDTPPFDPDHYGITIMGADERFDPSIVRKYATKGGDNIIAQIIRVGDGADREVRFSLGRLTRVRIYAIGEGVGREMVDYGWIQEASTGNVIWEMNYALTVHAGGARKNRMANASILLDKGDYVLHFKTDDSHAYGDWNSDPPDDQQYYGITVYRDEGQEGLPALPAPPMPPLPPQPGTVSPTVPPGDE